MTDLPEPPIERPPLSRWRWIVAFVGAVLMLFGGGAGLFFLGLATIADAGEKDVLIILAGGVFGVAPLVLGFLIWWPAVHWNR